MAKNTNVLKSRGPDALLEVKSALRASAQSKSSARLRNKRAMMKGSPTPKIHMYNMEEPASCASREGADPPQCLEFSHPALFPECTALPVQESVFILVLVF